MMSAFTLVRDISLLVGLSEDELLRESIAAYLRDKKRSLMAEKFEILSRYQVTSAEEIKKRIEEGGIHDHPAWEDYIELTNLIEELQRTENVIRSFAETA